MVNLGTRALVKIGNTIWFSASNINGLFKIDIDNLKIEFVHRFQCVDINQAMLHSGKIVFYNNELYIFPYYSNIIVSYNIITREETIIKIPECSLENLFVSIVLQKDSKVYFYGDTCLRFYVLDMESKKVKKHVWGQEMFSQFSLGQIGWGAYYSDRLIIVLHDKNGFIEIKNDISKYYSIPDCFSNRNLFRACYDGNLYWLIFFESTDIYSWNPKTQEVERYTLDDSIKVEAEKYFYQNFWMFENDFYIVGNSLCGIFQIDRKTKRIKLKFRLPKEFEILYQKNGEAMLFEQYQIVDKDIWMFPLAGNQLIIYNPESNQVKGVDFSIKGTDIPNFDIVGTDIYIKNRDILMEGVLGLEEYLYLLNNLKEE